MNPLLTFAPGWNISVPAGTMLIRADVVLNNRPGPGGYAAIIEAADVADTVVLRGGTPDTTTEAMTYALIADLAKEIRGNRAVILVRTTTLSQIMTKALKAHRMIRILGNSPLAVADATRHAAVMAERAACTRHDHHDRLLDARFERNEQFSEAQDTGTVHDALQELMKTLGDRAIDRPDVAIAAQRVLDATERHRVARLGEVLRGLTANDMPKRTKES